MKISGASFIAGKWLFEENAAVFNAFSPKNNEQIDTVFYEATSAMLDKAVLAGHAAFKIYRKISFPERAKFLSTIANEIEALGDELISVTHNETGLPTTRLYGERTRTIEQLRTFAKGLSCSHDGILNLSKVDEADLQRTPIAKPRTQLDYLPVGVVAVFGASNFPYAFSTLGGDTAAALAAGCPVIMKSHTAHPATNELMTRAIERAINKCSMPDGVFSMIQAKKYDIAHALVAADEIKAVGFTGSFNVANKLIETINKRKEIIPFYGELGSINPQFIMQNKAKESAVQLGEQLCHSMLMGNGQFCTSPGIWMIPSTANALLDSVQTTISVSESDSLLSPNILNNFRKGIANLINLTGVELLAKGKLSKSFHANAHVFETDISTFLATPELQHEVFGPMALVVKYDSHKQLNELIDKLEGQLTASIHGTVTDLAEAEDMIEALQYKVGRIIENQMPTGVEVCASMNHGGPHPSSSDVRATSVGLNAIQRFIRPICRQTVS